MRNTVGLNMIVKNESHIIRGTLEMLCSKLRFDYWVICDTGSTDDTREIIAQFFKEKNIPGELHCDEWVDFAHNRTLALQRAFNKTDLLFIFDADDELHGTITIPDKVVCDEYQLKFGQPNSGMNYTRTLLINNRKRFKYFAVLHEYISCQEPTPARTCILEGDYYVISGRTGSRNRDPDKYLKDATVLASAHADALAKGDDLYKRYAFYCANSYRDCGKYEDAIRWYKITLSQDNWPQEKYVACLYAYQCFEALNQKETGFFYLVKAFAYDNERVECLYPLLVHYCCEGMNELAHGYYRMVRMPTTPKNEGKLFVETDKAGFFVPYYMIIVADRVGDRECGIRMYETIFKTKHRTFSAWHLRNLMFNLRFFINHVKPDAMNAFVSLANEYLKFVMDNGVPGSTFADLDETINPRAAVRKEKSKSKRACKHSRNLLFYTGYCNTEWNYSEMKVGALGGSETAVAHLSKELGQLLKTLNGCTVYVAGQVRAEELAECNVKYVGLTDLPDLLCKTDFHTVICSRYVSFLEIYGSACSFHQFYIWAHDTHLLAHGCNLSDTAIIEKWADCIDGCVCQTRWHAGQYAELYPTLKSKLQVINNGIDAQLFPALGKKVRNRFIYTSRTERGLSRLLELWPDIMGMLPDATLVISTYVQFPCNDDERRIQARIAQLNQMHPSQQAEEEGVQCIRHLGKLNPTQLYAEMGAAEYWLYPTDWPETSCITAMEMLMSGVICLYYPVAGLTDTMNGCGIQIAPGSEVETLIGVVARNENRQREQGRAYAEGCSWTHRAQQWIQALNLLDFKTVVINLKRRPDRKAEMEARLHRQNFTDYEFMDAVDGKELVATEYIYELFKGNNFHYRKGVIGCAMSHIALWKQLMDDPTCDMYVIIEDDAVPVDDFELKLQKAVRLFASEPRAELCFIGGFSITVPCENANNLHIIQHPCAKKNGPVDGTGGYIVKKSGATRFLDYCKTRSIVVAIDWYILGMFNEHLCSVNEYLLYTYNNDTDIQSSFDPLLFPSAETDMTRTNTRANTDFRNQNNVVVTVAFCDWWETEYGGGTFNVHDNFFVNIIKQYSGFKMEVVEPHQNPDVLFYSLFGHSVGSYRAGRKVFFAGESVPPRADADFNITFDASNAVNARVPVWVCYFDEAILRPNASGTMHKREKFCSYIASQPGFENNRERFVQQLSTKYKRVDCGGKHLNNIGGAIPPGVNASGKIEHNKQYKFAIAFENKQYPGYVTEKICDAYKSGCIPIYWGTPDVVQDFNPSTFINANDFSDFDALIDHIRRVDCDDELYASYFKDPILSDAWMRIFADPAHAFFKQIVSDILTFDI